MCRRLRGQASREVCSKTGLSGPTRRKARPAQRSLLVFFSPWSNRKKKLFLKVTYPAKTLAQREMPLGGAPWKDPRGGPHRRGELNAGDLFKHASDAIANA